MSKPPPEPTEPDLVTRFEGPYPCPGECGGDVLLFEFSVAHHPAHTCAWFEEHDAVTIEQTVRERAARALN